MIYITGVVVPFTLLGFFYAPKRFSTTIFVPAVDWKVLVFEAGYDQDAVMSKVLPLIQFKWLIEFSVDREWFPVIRKLY